MGDGKSESGLAYWSLQLLIKAARCQRTSVTSCLLLPPIRTSFIQPRDNWLADFSLLRFERFQGRAEAVLLYLVHSREASVRFIIALHKTSNNTVLQVETVDPRFILIGVLNIFAARPKYWIPLTGS